MQASPAINGERLRRGIEELAALTDPTLPYTRQAFSDHFTEGRRYLTERFQRAGLEVQVDPAGNLIGRRPGTDPTCAPIAAGSHSDTVPAGGRFDGILGVVAGLEVAETLAGHDIALRHPLEVIDFLAEEPGPYGLSCVGSRALAGEVTPDMLENAADDGSTLADALAKVGGDPARFASCRRTPNQLHCFLELHIEQGPVLEQAGLPIGVVTDIVGITRVEISIKGRASHAGTTPMDLRLDALVGAASIVSFVAARAAEYANAPGGFVATIGRLNVSPNGANVVPGQVDLILEARSGSDSLRRDFMAEVDAHVAALAGLGTDVRPISDAPAVQCANRIVKAFSNACESAGLDYRLMPSGASHDTAHMSQIGPAGMIFIPCRDGLSHSPDEWADPEHMTRGAQILCSTVVAMDASA